MVLEGLRKLPIGTLTSSYQPLVSIKCTTTEKLTVWGLDIDSCSIWKLIIAKSRITTYYGKNFCNGGRPKKKQNYHFFGRNYRFEGF